MASSAYKLTTTSTVCTSWPEEGKNKNFDGKFFISALARNGCELWTAAFSVNPKFSLPQNKNASMVLADRCRKLGVKLQLIPLKVNVVTGGNFSPAAINMGTTKT